MLKRSTALLLVIVMLTAALSSCSFLTDINIFEEESIIDALESIFSDTEKDNRPVEDIVIANDVDYIYTVVISNELEEDVQMDILNKISELLISHNVKISNRIESRYDEIGEAANEIVVGLTARPESRELNESIAPGEYIVDYNYDSHRISILGSTSELTYEGFEYLIDSFLDVESKTITVPSDLHYSKKGDYPLTSLKIDGVDIRNYSIVVPSLNPSEDDLYAYYTALNIGDYLEARLGVELKIVDDNKDEAEYEILVGETNRVESSTKVTLAQGQYVLAKKDTKLVLRGNGIYVAAGMGEIVSNYLSGKSKKVNITDLPTSDTAKNYTAPTQIKNVILMIGDGMGHNQINAALTTRLNSFAAQSFTSTGKSVTRSISVINGESTYTDSAAGGTALSTGYKTINGYLGKDANGNNLINIRELADSYGAKTAVVTTDAITGATPGAFLAHNISRENTEEIQESIDKLIANGKVEYCEGAVDNDLTVHTRNALNTIAYSGSPFFMMVEEGHIDKNCHSNKMEATLDTVVRFNDSIIYAATFSLVNADTILIVTADHETGGLVEDSSAETGYSFTSKNHTNADVPIYVLGSDMFNGQRVENVEIPKYMATFFDSKSFGSQVEY